MWGSAFKYSSNKIDKMQLSSHFDSSNLQKDATGPLLGRPHTSLADKCPGSSSSQRRNRPKVPHPNFLSLTFSFTANLFGFKSVTKSFAVQRELHFDSLRLWSLLPNCCLIDQVLPETLWSKKIKKSTRVLAKMALNVQEICIDEAKKSQAFE